MGGIASGGAQPGSNALFLGDRVHRGGVVGVCLVGNVAVDAIIAYLESIQVDAPGD